MQRLTRAGKIGLYLACICVIFLAGCNFPGNRLPSLSRLNPTLTQNAGIPGTGNQPAGKATSAPTPTTRPTSITVTPSTPQMSMTPTAAGGMGYGMATPSGYTQPVVMVSDQQIQNGTVRIDDVVSAGPGWVVVYTVKNRQPDQAIGHTHVNAGDNPNVIVKIDTTQPVDTLYAQLHVDAGKVGTFEFPGVDSPVMMGVQMIASTFKTNVKGAVGNATQPASGSIPSITIQNQVIHDGAVIASHVVATGESWVVIHPINPDGTMGDYIGATAVHPGVTENVVIHIDVSKATQKMYAMLHVNVSKAARPQFPGIDAPVMVAGKMVLPPFQVTGSLTGDVPLGTSKTAAGVPYLTDGFGASLYLYLKDQPGNISCTGDCLNQWHPLLATGPINPAAGVSAAKLGVVTLPDRTRQVTYAGSPLYYFTGDQKPGDTKGQGLGGSWFLVTP